MLFELNKLWLAKEESVLARCRLTYEGEIARLKRKTEERYDEMVARKQIQRLKKELTDVKVLKSQPRGQNNL